MHAPFRSADGMSPAGRRGTIPMRRPDHKTNSSFSRVGHHAITYPNLLHALWLKAVVGIRGSGLNRVFFHPKGKEARRDPGAGDNSVTGLLAPACFVEYDSW